MTNIISRLTAVFLALSLLSACKGYQPNKSLANSGGSGPVELPPFDPMPTPAPGATPSPGLMQNYLPLSSGNLKYFGFWTGYLGYEGLIPEVRGFVNFVHFQANWGDINSAMAAGLRLVITPPDDAADIPAWANIVKPHQQRVIAFLVQDEIDCVSAGNPARMAELIAGVEQRATLLKNIFPGAKVMMTLGCFRQDVIPNSGFRVPNGVDYIALEAYYGTATWREWLQRLEPFMNANHRLFMMPGASTSYGDDSSLIARASDILAFAQSDARVIGIWPFTYYSYDYNCAEAGVFCGNGVPGENYNIKPRGGAGVRDMPGLRTHFYNMGKQITMQNTRNPPSSAQLPIDPPPGGIQAPGPTVLWPQDVRANMGFTLDVFGGYYYPGSTIQYSVNQGASYVDAGGAHINVNHVRLGVPAGVPAGQYYVRVRNPDGVVSYPLIFNVAP